MPLPEYYFQDKSNLYKNDQKIPFFVVISSKIEMWSYAAA